MLHFLSEQSSFTLWMIFLAENVAITLIAIAVGSYVIRRHLKQKPVASKREILFCIVTNLLNTVITTTAISIATLAFTPVLGISFLKPANHKKAL